MVFDCWQVKLCDGFFVLQVRSYNIHGTFLNLFQLIRLPFGYTSWPSRASILYYRSDDAPIAWILSTCGHHLRSLDTYIPRSLEMITLSISRPLIFKSGMNGVFFKTGYHFLGFLSIDLHVVVIWSLHNIVSVIMYMGIYRIRDLLCYSGIIHVFVQKAPGLKVINHTDKE